jgi:hypothetical protein
MSVDHYLSFNYGLQELYFFVNSDNSCSKFELIVSMMQINTNIQKESAMKVKRIMAILVVSSFSGISVVADQKGRQTCSVAQVEADAAKQVNSLIRLYDASSNSDDKECLARAMRDLLEKLIKQSEIFGKAMEAEVIGGELEASIVNEQEQVVLKDVIITLNKKLGMIDAQQSSNKIEKIIPSKQEQTSRKRQRATN